MRKGMSQVLALIVAASVLMMTALTVIFLAQGSLGGLGQTSTMQTCISTLETQCTASGSGTVSMPSTCITRSDGQEELIDGYPEDEYRPLNNRDDASCPQQ